MNGAYSIDHEIVHVMLIRELHHITILIIYAITITFVLLTWDRAGRALPLFFNNTIRYLISSSNELLIPFD